MKKFDNFLELVILDEKLSLDENILSATLISFISRYELEMKTMINYLSTLVSKTPSFI